MENACSPDKDFLRHIANKVLSENINKIPANIIDDIRKQLGRGEDKYKFTIFGGNPARLADYLDSEDWRDLVDLAKNLHLEWLLREILERLEEEYRSTCPMVAEKARAAAERLAEAKEEEKKLDRDSVFRGLKYAGYKVELTKEGAIEVEEPNIKVRIEIVNNKIHYTICKEGTASTIDAIMARIEKIREI
ncbi:MAG: hypothetical protein GSR86_06455 [Desulfurococcales archaeon]|nr:hypothetical protein [Desulfurococcales archaeon]